MAKRFVKSKLYNTWNGKTDSEKQAYSGSVIFAEDRKFIIEGNADGDGFVEFDGRTPVNGECIEIYELAKDGTTYEGKLEINHGAPLTGSALSLTNGGSASGTFDVVTAINKDKFGHITGATKKSVTLPTANVTSNLVATNSATGTSTNTSASTNTTTYLNHVEGSNVNNSIQIKGTDQISVSAVNDVITIDHTTPGTGAALSLTAGAGLTPSHGGTFDVITGISKDTNGHITGATKQTVTLPADNNTTYSFSGGTNKVTVTPSNGTAYDVTITPSLTVSATATDDDVVILSGTAGTNGVTFDAKHAQKGPSSGYTSGNTTTSISGSGDSKTIKIPQITVDKYGHVTAASDESVSITLPTVNNATLTIQANGVSKGTFTANQSSNKTINITAADLGLTGAIKFKGIVTTLPTSYTDYELGNVVMLSGSTKEYILSSKTSDTVGTWTELGDENSHALKTVKVEGSGVLGGGGDLSTNRTITHNKVLGTAVTTAIGGVSGNTITVPTITADEYGHIKTIGSASFTHSDNNSAHSHSAGVGLSLSGTGGTSGTTTYTLKTAGTSEIGGIKVHKDNSSYTVTASASSISADVTSGKYYAVEIDKNDKAFVYVPWANDNTTYKAGTGLSLSGTTFNHSNSITAGTVSGGSGTLAHGGTFTVPSITYDAQGHIKSTTTTTYTLPASGDTDKKTSSTADTSADTIYLVGAKSQSSSGVTTYTNASVYEKSGVVYGKSSFTSVVGAMINTDDWAWEVLS